MTLFGKIIAGVLIIGGIGGVAYFINQDVAPEVVQQEVKSIETATTTEAPQTGKKMAFSQFIKTDQGSYKCEINQTTAGIVSKGTVYINKGNIRGEFMTSVSGQTITSSMIIKDGYSYTWTSMAPTTGFKIKIPNETDNQGNNVETKQNTTGTQGTYSWNSENVGDYSCEAVALDEARFTVPTGITFTEIKK